jgi:hypothetical protein
MQVTPTLTLFKHSKGKSPFHHATFRLLLYIAVKISGRCPRLPPKRLLQPESLPKLFADLPADAKPIV